MTARTRLFRLITCRLHPGEILPWWAVAARYCLFPLEAIGCRFYSPIRNTYTIRGTDFSGEFFDAFEANDRSAVYRITRDASSGLVTVHRYQLPLDPDSLAELQS
jgi:hypothetical protein